MKKKSIKILVAIIAIFIISAPVPCIGALIANLSRKLFCD